MGNNAKSKRPLVHLRQCRPPSWLRKPRSRCPNAPAAGPPALPSRSIGDLWEAHLEEGSNRRRAKAVALRKPNGCRGRLGHRGLPPPLQTHSPFPLRSAASGLPVPIPLGQVPTCLSWERLSLALVPEVSSIAPQPPGQEWGGSPSGSFPKVGFPLRGLLCSDSGFDLFQQKG